MRKLKIKISFFFILLTPLFFSCHQSQKKPLQVNRLFSDHMVLQQQQEVTFWGEYTPNRELTVSASWGEEVSAKTDSGGKWEVNIATPEAGGPYSIHICTKDSTISINDVLVGEVWLASGQSNMEMTLNGWPPRDTVQNAKKVIAEARYPGFRMLTVETNPSDKPFDTVAGNWVVASPGTVGTFSATAFFFARRLYEELNVPIGIIHSSWGGTVAEAWTSEGGLRNLGDFNEVLDAVKTSDVRKKAADWFANWNEMEMPLTDEEWQNISFSDLEAAQANFDDSHWDTVGLPGRFDKIGSGVFDGAMWFRKTFTVENAEVDYVLRTGPINDMDATYINGQKIGGLAGENFWKTPREMVVPKTLLKKGVNTIAIRAIDRRGKGSFSGPMTISNSMGDTISMEGNWKYRLIAEIFMNRFYVYTLNSDFSERPDLIEFHPNLPSVLYNGMIHPLTNYKIKGAIWYQGESNVGRDEQYRRLFPAMIEDWRAKWGYDFPFYFVQIAPYNYAPERLSQKLRDAQRCALKTPNTGMVVTLDIGNPANIHPANKQEVGKRLAGLALDNNYGKDLVASGPLYRQTIKSDKKLIVEFDYIGSGLVASTKGLFGFEIAGEDKNYLPAKAKIVGDKVEVFNADIDYPEYVRYAWKNESEASLFNREGLPASTFTSEKF
ncbi:glycosyl hydrolase family 2 [Mariniphaga sediminis]|uniref:Glycosyl hydrolase family 2 n=1 Tax=Mariniphaga sediminis TaxID=1628158 RepID=A0A399D4T6_9BACT|nr:sialate O-acetylesterase [Mariniphaga sediminis]RIH66925.1 glycosyl hydrolase family 2 [Mariniphaga sediminis]